MTGFKKVNPGDPLQFPADDYNAAMDAAKWYAQNRGSDGYASSNPLKQAGTILVQNNGSAITAPGGVLGIDSPLVLPSANLTQFQSNLALQGSTPNTSKHVGKFVVTLGPLNPGKIGRAVLCGYAAVQVSMLGAADGYADILNSTQGYLQSSSYGSAQILWTEGKSGTSPQWAVVRICNFTGSFLCTIASNIAAAGSISTTTSGTTCTLGSGTATLWALSSSGVATATGFTFTIYNSTKAAIAAKYSDGSYKLLQGKVVNRLPLIDVEGCG